MTETLVAMKQETQSQPPSVGDLDPPMITLLGSLDDDQGAYGLGLDAESPKAPVLVILYNGI